MKLLRWLLDLIYPPKCPFCGKLLSEDESDLCRKCRMTLPEAHTPIQRGEFYTCCHSVFYYDEKVAQSIKRFKFHGMRQYSEVYGRLLAMLILRERIDFDLLSWVPSSDKRKRSRGYDQTLLIAQTVAQELNVSCHRLLIKTVDNVRQSTISDSAARRANVLGVFECRDEAVVKGKRVLLIDDVITSGATLTECARVLMTAGAASVECATFAATKEKVTKQ